MIPEIVHNMGNMIDKALNSRRKNIDHAIHCLALSGLVIAFNSSKSHLQRQSND